VGASLSDPVGTNGYNGMAPGALLVVQDAGFSVFDSCADLVGLGCPVTNFLPSLRQAHAQGARVHNNSWGDNEDGVFTNLHAYTQASRDLDGMTWEYRDFLVCARPAIPVVPRTRWPVRRTRRMRSVWRPVSRVRRRNPWRHFRAVAGTRTGASSQT
jgi:hypothetical protein